MPGETEAGHVGHRGHAVGNQSGRSRLVRTAHLVERGRNPLGARARLHRGREQDAGAERPGQHQCIAGPQSRFAENLDRLDIAGHRQSERQFRALAGMTADQRNAVAVEAGACAGQKLEQGFPDLAGARRGNDGGRQRVTRLAAHGVDVAQRMVGGDLAEHIRIVHERAEEIDGLHQVAPRAWRRHRGIVGRVEADHHIGSQGWRKARQRARQRVRPDLRATATAPHVLEAGNRRAAVRGCAHPYHHRAGVLVHPHPSAVDPVLQRPDPGALGLEPAARCDGVTLAGRDQREKVALRTPRLHRLAARVPAKIGGERRTGAHRNDAGFLARRRNESGAIAGREYVGIVRHLQARPDRQEAAGIERKPGAGEPRRRRRGRGCEHRVGDERRRIFKLDPIGPDRPCAPVLMELDAALAQDAPERLADARIVRGEDLAVRHQREREPFGVVAVARPLPHAGAFGPRAEARRRRHRRRSPQFAADRRDRGTAAADRRISAESRRSA